MPVKRSNVDDNTSSNDYDPLKNESEKRIPEEGEEWTDHNTHDPGLTVSSGILDRIIRLFRNFFSGKNLPSNLKLPSTKKGEKSESESS